jgi:hypothetical protein
MSDTETKDALALEILEEALQQWLEEGSKAGENRIAYKAPDGEMIVEYEGEHKQGYGTIICRLLPKKAVIRILSECEQLFDGFMLRLRSGETVEEARSGEQEWETGFRDRSIRRLAWFATLMMLEHFKMRLGEAQEVNFHTALLGTGAAWASMCAQLNIDPTVRSEVNGLPLIEKHVGQVAKREESFIRELLQDLPKLHIPEKGRRSDWTSWSKQEREAAFHKALEEVKSANKGRFPTLNLVAGKINAHHMLKPRLTGNVLGKTLKADGVDWVKARN